LPPQPARPHASVSVSQPISRFCSGGPLGSRLSLVPTTLPAHTRTLPRRERLPLPPVTIHQSQITKSFTIRTSENHARKPCRIRTSKTQHLKSFRIRTYKKTGGGGYPSFVISSTSSPYSLAREDNQAFASGPRQWTRREITGTLLVTRRVSPRAFPPPQPSGRAHAEVLHVSVSLTKAKTKASQT
jgi:hypothetical protein